MADVAEAARIMVDAGFAIDLQVDEGIDFRIESEIAVQDGGDNLDEVVRSIAWTIFGESKSSSCRAWIDWPGQTITSKWCASPADAARWLVTMFHRFGVPMPMAERADLEHLEPVAKLARAAGLFVELSLRGGYQIVSRVLVRAAASHPLGLSFGVFVEPGGGYYVAKRWPGIISSEVVLATPQEVLSWIQASR